MQAVTVYAYGINGALPKEADRRRVEVPFYQPLAAPVPALLIWLGAGFIVGAVFGLIAGTMPFWIGVGLALGAIWGGRARRPTLTAITSSSAPP